MTKQVYHWNKSATVPIFFPLFFLFFFPDGRRGKKEHLLIRNFFFFLNAASISVEAGKRVVLSFSTARFASSNCILG